MKLSLKSKKNRLRKNSRSTKNRVSAQFTPNYLGHNEIYVRDNSNYVRQNEIYLRDNKI